MADIIDVNIADQTIEVFWQDEVELNLDLNLMYIKSGEQEIKNYVDNVSKPEIDNYIKTEAKPIVSEVVVQIAEPTVNEYLETETKPAIDEYFNDKKPEIEDLVSQAENYASSSQTSAQASAASALAAETALTTLTTTATDNFNTNAENKTNAFNTNASEKQSQIDASADAAELSETNAKASELAAKESEDNAKASELNAAESANTALEAATKASFGNIGDIKYTSRTDVPNGGAWCDGTEYTQAQFPDIYQMLVDGKLQHTDYTTFDESVSTNGSCGFFGLDTETTSFKVPKLSDVYLKAGQAPSAFGAESLPNITAQVSMTNGEYHSPSGAISISNTGATRGASGSDISGINQAFSLNASRSSSTYQDGAKVNPDHVVYRAYVVLYATAAEASEAQAAEFINAVTDLRDELSLKKNIAYENDRYIPCTGAATVVLQDTDEILSLGIENNTTITFDRSQLSFPKYWATFQLKFLFPNGAKTVSISPTQLVINGNVPDFSDGKGHWVVIRFARDSTSNLILSDAGTEG